VPVEFTSINNHRRKHYPSVKPGSGHDLFYKLGRGEFRLKQDTDPSPRYKQDFEQVSDDTENRATNDESEEESAVQATATRKNTNQQSNIDLLIGEFPRYLQIFERNPPFRKYGQWEYHIETIQRRRELGSAVKAI
jgi:hypothetical protein